MEIKRITMAEIIQARDEEMEKLGMTWEELKSYALDCGCCVRLPSKYQHLDELYVSESYRNYRLLSKDGI